ncbi:hypothetical protein KFL_001120170 [Klebsormidium nitens]|uniref:Uncharacterized protein n=1 Tax=Klebsormidium nitens TaxID=105231 RepID=A0A1Y1HWD3_KLENI|nr:hypothetical protein KFL_001120170 [Klebsormidium nitens]|eukprot:GAQ82473.1 hypothetical protein KFL_001120170 [Klebsormidium nitens]
MDDDDVPIALTPTAKAEKKPAVKRVKKEEKKSDKGKEKKKAKPADKKGKGKETKKVADKKTEVKKERKVYDLPGQKHDIPAERDPLRVFYESLYNQRPESEMAQFWMMEHGLLDEDLAQKVFEKKQKLLRKGTIVASPAKGRSASKSSSKSKKATPASKTKKGKSSSKKKSDEKPAKKKPKK